MGPQRLGYQARQPRHRGQMGRLRQRDAKSTHLHRIYWPGMNSVSVERNVKFAATVETVHIPFPLLHGGEQEDSQPAANQQVQPSPSTASSITPINLTLTSHIPVPTPPRLTTRSMTCAANAQSSDKGNTTGDSAQTQPAPQGATPHGESASHISVDNNSADFIFHVD